MVSNPYTGSVLLRRVLPSKDQGYYYDGTAPSIFDFSVALNLNGLAGMVQNIIAQPILISPSDTPKVYPEQISVYVMKPGVVRLRDCRFYTDVTTSDKMFYSRISVYVRNNSSSTGLESVLVDRLYAGDSKSVYSLPDFDLQLAEGQNICVRMTSSPVTVDATIKVTAKLSFYCKVFFDVL